MNNRRIFYKKRRKTIEKTWKMMQKQGTLELYTYTIDKLIKMN